MSSPPTRSSASEPGCGSSPRSPRSSSRRPTRPHYRRLQGRRRRPWPITIFVIHLTVLSARSVQGRTRIPTSAVQTGRETNVPQGRNCPRSCRRAWLHDTWLRERLCCSPAAETATRAYTAETDAHAEPSSHLRTQWCLPSHICEVGARRLVAQERGPPAGDLVGPGGCGSSWRSASRRQRRGIRSFPGLFSYPPGRICRASCCDSDAGNGRWLHPLRNPSAADPAAVQLRSEPAR